MKFRVFNVILLIMVLYSCKEMEEGSNVIELLIPDNELILLDGNEVKLESFEIEFLKLYNKKINQVELPIIVDFQVAEDIKMKNVNLLMKTIKSLEDIKLEFSTYEHKYEDNDEDYRVSNE